MKLRMRGAAAGSTGEAGVCDADHAGFMSQSLRQVTRWPLLLGASMLPLSVGSPSPDLYRVFAAGLLLGEGFAAMADRRSQDELQKAGARNSREKNRIPKARR